MKTRSRISLIAGAVVVLSVSFNTFAGGSPYWVGSDGKYARGGFGECLRTIDWSPEKAIADCEGDAAKAEAARKAAAKAAAEKAAAEKAAAAAAAAKAAAERKSAPIKPMPVTRAPQYRKVSLASGASFRLGGSTLSAEGKAAIADLLKQFKGETIESVIVEGHTDSTGPAAFNQRLSEKRAEAVKAELIARGVDAAVIKTVGYGSSRPVASNATREGRAQNRRVDIKVDAKKRQM